MITAGAGRARQIAQTQPVLGPHGDLVDDLEDAMAAEATPGDHAFEQIR